MKTQNPDVSRATAVDHGTFKTVRHGDRVQSQDFMKFPVTIGGRHGTGTLTWASSVKTKK